mgnify:CR=1 FL=1|tara:strand:+ start:12 stop:665 length:654 start_codon:yes stop_codon:yes gene_type:complete
MLKENYFSNSNFFFKKELFRRQNWLRNNEDKKAINEWQFIYKNIKKNKEFQKVHIAYNFSKNLNYKHPGLSSNIYFYHPLRVCIMSTKLNSKKSAELMTLCLLHNVFETTDINEKIIKKIFGKKICSYLKILTVDRENEWKKNYKNNYYNRIKKSNINLVLVKILDKLDNLYLLKNNKNNKIKKRYLAEIQKYLMPLVKSKVKKIYDHFETLIEFSK